MKNPILILILIFLMFVLYMHFFLPVPDFSSEKTKDTIQVDSIEIKSQKTGVNADTLNIYEIKNYSQSK